MCIWTIPVLQLREHAWSLLIKCFLFFMKSPVCCQALELVMFPSAEIPFTKCLWSPYTHIPDPISATPACVEKNMDCVAVLSCYVSFLLWNLFCHCSVWVSLKTGACQHSPIKTPPPQDVALFCAVSAAHLPSFVAPCPCCCQVRYTSDCVLRVP